MHRKNTQQAVEVIHSRVTAHRVRILWLRLDCNLGLFVVERMPADSERQRNDCSRTHFGAWQQT